jgi:hypothetical protein
MKPCLFLILLILLIVIAPIPLASSAHYILGLVNDSQSFVPADSHTIVLWNPLVGTNDNLTDTIGPNGNSMTNNIYMIDCEMLLTPCSIGDILYIRVVDNGDSYITDYSQVTVTGAGYDIANELRLNSPPNVTLNTPSNFGNSSGLVRFNCTSQDLDSNLKNVTLYGNWTGSFSENETLSATPSSYEAIFTKNISEGRYIWNCLATDNLSVSNVNPQNFTVTIDVTAPEISSININISYACKNAYARVNCTVNDRLSGIGSVIIQAIKPGSTQNYSASILNAGTYYSDILMDEAGVWKFNCYANDSAGNTANLTSQNFTSNSDLPNLFISSNGINFDTIPSSEGQLISINATVYNLGCEIAQNFPVAFIEGNISSGIQINSNITLSLPGLSNTTLNTTYISKMGLNNIFVSLDINSTVSEDNELDNTANNSFYISAWQEIYGNVTLEKTLSNINLNNLSQWQAYTGNIFIADKEANIGWLSLQAIGKNITNGTADNDFTEIDSILRMSGFEDSVSSSFTTDGNTPRLVENFTINSRKIDNVPVINSTNNTLFMTGILWDMSDTLGTQYSYSGREDIVFVTQVNKQKPGKYGICDYEIRIPARLREYDPADSKEVYLYYSIE